MGEDLPVIYVETSAINYLLDHYKEEQIVFIRDCLKEITRGKICLSPVTFWEIACTGNGDRKEDLIKTCQIFFDNVTLFPDPIQVLNIYLAQGCPLQQSRDDFWECSGPFSKVWQSTAPDLNKTIVIEGTLITEDKIVVKYISSLLQKIIKNDFSLAEQSDDEYYCLACEEINRVYNQFRFVREDSEKGIASESRKIYKLTIFFAYMLLVLGISFGNTDIDTFWKERGIVDIDHQVYYLFKNDETLFHRGPLVYMAMMALAQVEHDSNRGLYKDCLHAMYMPYCNSFLSNDQHFIQLKEKEPHELWGRITSIESFCDNLLNTILQKDI